MRIFVYFMSPRLSIETELKWVTMDGDEVARTVFPTNQAMAKAFSIHSKNNLL